MKEITITDKEENQRLDKYLLKYFNNAPKSFVYKMLRKKRIKYNSAKGAGNEILKSGDKVQMYISDDTVSELGSKQVFDENTPILFTKLYEDKNILVVNKPAGCLSQKESKDTKNSLVEQILFYLWEKGEYEIGDGFSPALCNRLDRNTSGIVIAGKSILALQEMSLMFQNGNISKYYITMVKGRVKKNETLKGFLAKDTKTNTVKISKEKTLGGKPVVTEYTVLAATDKFSLLEVNIKTGRPHQIRAHLEYAGYPIIGDKKYGHRGTNMTFIRKYGLNHQFLHAHKILFNNIEGDYSYLNGKEITCPLSKEQKVIIDEFFGGL